MGTYSHKKLLTNWKTGRLTKEMALGHALQHIGLLYEGQTQANQRRQNMREEITELKATLTTCQQENEALRHRVAQMQQQLEAFNVTLYQLKDDVDSLTQKPSQAPSDEA